MRSSSQLVFLIFTFFSRKTNSEQPEPVTLYLHEALNFEGLAHEISFSSCQTIPISLVNKISSVRTGDACVILYENENCAQDGSMIIRLTTTNPTRNDLKSQKFNLGSAKPCLTPASNEQVGQTQLGLYNRIPVIHRYSDSDTEEEYDHGAGVSKIQTTRRHDDDLLDVDYGDRVEVDSEPDDAGDGSFLASSSARPRQPDINESNTNETAVNPESDINAEGPPVTKHPGFIILDEVPFPGRPVVKFEVHSSGTSSAESLENIHSTNNVSQVVFENVTTRSEQIEEGTPLNKSDSSQNIKISQDSWEEYAQPDEAAREVDLPAAVPELKNSTDFPIIQTNADDSPTKLPTTNSPTSTTTKRTRPTTTAKPMTTEPEIASTGTIKQKTTTIPYYGVNHTTTTTTTTAAPTHDTTISPVTNFTTITTTTIPILPTTTTTEFSQVECINETMKCTIVDGYTGNKWEVCAPHKGMRSCPGNSSGVIYWECLSGGTFEMAYHPNYDNCTTAWIDELDRLVEEKEDETTIEAEMVLSQILQNIKSPEAGTTPQKGLPVYFGHEINKIVSLVDSTVQKSSAYATDISQYENICEKSVNIFETLLSQENIWKQLDQRNRSTIATHLLDSVETTMLSLGKVAALNSPNEMMSNYEKSYNRKSTIIKIVTGVFRKMPVESQYFGGMMERNTAGGVHNNYNNSPQVLQSIFNISLPFGWENTVAGETVRFVGLTLDHNHSSQLFPSHNNRLGNRHPVVLASEIIGLSLANELSNQPAKVAFPGEGVKIKFSLGDQSDIDRMTQNEYGTPSRYGSKSYGKPICTFWDPEQMVWSVDGSRLIQFDDASVICEYTHLTLFAVLMDVHGYTAVKDATLHTLTIVLCTLSSLCLLATIITLKQFKSAKSPSTSITIQLCVCLLIGNILIINVMEKANFNLSDTSCSVAALLIHYVLLCAFTWMAIEGYIVLKMVLDVFSTGTEHKLILAGIAYGIPLMLVCTLSVLHFMGIQHVYGGQLHCWLNGFYLLAFIIPVIVIVLGNLVALSVALRVAHQADRRYTEQIKKKVRSFRTWIIGTSALTSILGLTWLFGFLLLIGNPTFGRIASYVFTVFNASQGIFIFVFHCLLNTKLQTAFKNRFISKSRGAELRSHSSTDSHRIKSGSSFSKSDTEKRNTELTSAGEEKREIDVHIEKDDSEDEIEARRRFLRSRSDSDDYSRKPAFIKYLDQNQGRKASKDSAFM